jgi:hypothetical protein
MAIAAVLTGFEDIAVLLCSEDIQHVLGSGSAEKAADTGNCPFRGYAMHKELDPIGELPRPRKDEIFCVGDRRVGFCNTEGGIAFDGELVDN